MHRQKTGVLVMMAGCYSINALKLLESVLSLSRQHVNCDDCWNVKGKIFRPFLSSSVQPVSKCCETETKLTFRFVFAAFMISASVLVPMLVFAYFLLIVEHLVVVTSAFSCQDYRNEMKLLTYFCAMFLFYSTVLCPCHCWLPVNVWNEFAITYCMPAL